MVEPTEKIGLCGGNGSERGKLTIPQGKEHQGSFARQADHGVDIFAIREIPRAKGKVRKRTAFVVPHELPLGSSGGGAPARPRKSLAQTGRQGKARAVRNIPLGEGREEGRVTDGVRGVELGKGRLDQLP